MEKELTIDQQQIIEKLATKIANLEIQLATEAAAREEITKYTGELERELKKYKSNE